MFPDKSGLIRVNGWKENRTHLQLEKGNAMILSSENSPQATGAVHTCAHTNTTVIRKESRRTDFRKPTAQRSLCGKHVLSWQIFSLPTGEPGCFWKKPREFTREISIVILPTHSGQHNSKILKIELSPPAEAGGIKVP